MYKEIGQYLSESYEALKNGNCTMGKYEEVLNNLISFSKTGLISSEEFERWDTLFHGIYSVKIENLNLSTRAKNCLKRESIYTCGELRKRLLSEGKKSEFFRIRNMGDVTAAEILREAIRCRFITREELLQSSWRPVYEEKVRKWLSGAQ